MRVGTTAGEHGHHRRYGDEDDETERQCELDGEQLPVAQGAQHALEQRREELLSEQRQALVAVSPVHHHVVEAQVVGVAGRVVVALWGHTHDMHKTRWQQ